MDYRTVLHIDRRGKCDLYDHAHIKQLLTSRQIRFFLSALNNAPSVNLDVLIPVAPANSTEPNPAFCMIPTRSLTGTAPPIQPVQLLRLFTTFSGRSSFRISSGTGIFSLRWRPGKRSAIRLTMKTIGNSNPLAL